MLKGSSIRVGRVSVCFLYDVVRICVLVAGLDKTSCRRSGVVLVAGVDEEVADFSVSCSE